MANLTAGETLSIEQTVADATAVEVRFGGPSAQAAVAMTASGSCWSADIDTSGFEPGRYAFELWATFAGGIKRVVGRDSVTIQPALAVGDVRSQAQIALDNIKAMLAGQAKEGVRRYRINNRELERYSVAELLQLKSHFQAEVLRETRRAAGRNSLGPRISAHF